MTRKYDRLDALYATLPAMECKGLCQECCGPIGMTKLEFKRISEKSGTTPSIDKELTCTLLKDGKCSVYDVRPAICRLWGLTQDMKCPHGCKPTRYLTKVEANRFLSKVDKIAGRKGLQYTAEGLEKFLKSIK